MPRIKNALDQILKAAIACQPEPGDAPTSDIPETERPAGLNNARQRSTTGVCGPQDAAHAGSRDMRDRYLILFEDLQNAEMREAPREPSAEGKADARAPWSGGWTLVRGPTRIVPLPRHFESIAGGRSSAYGSGVLRKQYFCTLMENNHRLMFEITAVPSY